MRIVPAILLSTALSAAVARLTAAEGIVGFDARHVTTEIPARLIADQVFEAKITVRNTGARAWGDGMKLRSQDPLDNATWGTSFIYLGQGRSLEPGGTIAFASFLRAPSTPGRHSFRWRVARNEDGAMFGEATPPHIVVVEPRPPEPPETPAPPRTPAPGASKKRVLSAADLEYAGSFKVPDEVEGCGAAFTESGLALRTARDGAKTLFVRTGLAKSIVYEAAIPALVRLEGADHSRLKVAEVRRVWGELKLPGRGDEAIAANAGFWWDEGKGILYWSSYHGYMTGRLPVLGASRLEDDGSVRHLGPWHVPDSISWYKCYWGGITPLGIAFAERFAGGRKLALGFGGYYSICAAASRGPALAAIAEPDPANRTLDMVELVAYPWPLDASAPRDGDYFVANSAWGGRPPESPRRGSWTMDDSVRAGLFIDLPDKHAFLALAFLGTGRIGYDYGTITSAGDACSWYFYDPEELGAAASGRKKPWEVLPNSWSRIAYPRGIRDGAGWRSTVGDPTGACLDAETRIVYIYQRFCIDNGTRELFPCIHAYRVK